MHPSLPHPPQLRAYLQVTFEEQGLGITRFNLAQSYPRRVYGEDSGGMTVEEAGLHGSVALFVQDLEA